MVLSNRTEPGANPRTSTNCWQTFPACAEVNFTATALVSESSLRLRTNRLGHGGSTIVFRQYAWGVHIFTSRLSKSVSSKPKMNGLFLALRVSPSINFLSLYQKIFLRVTLSNHTIPKN